MSPDLLQLARKRDAADNAPGELTIRQWQTNCKQGPLVESTIHFDGTVVIFDNFFRNVEAQTGSVSALFSGKVGIENLSDLLRIDTRAAVFDNDVDIKVSPHASD